MKSIEEIVNLLNAHGSVASYEKAEYPAYNRTIKCTALLGDFTIEWWSNLINVQVGCCMVVATDIYVSACWPNNYKYNIILENGGNVVGVIPLVEY